MELKKTLRITKAVSDGNRLRVLMALAHQKELCACHISELLRVSPPTVSRHMNILETAGLVTARKDSRWVHYRLSDETREPAMRPLIKWLGEALKAAPAIVQDRTTLGGIAPCSDGKNNSNQRSSPRQAAKK